MVFTKIKSFKLFLLSRFASASIGGLSGGYAAYKFYKVVKLRNLIKEHKIAHKNVVESQQFLKKICERVNIIDLDDPEERQLKWNQFKIFRNKTREFQAIFKR